MNFFLDENFPKSAHEYLIGLGHRTFDIRGTEAEGADDTHILARSLQENAIVLTTDRDFFHTLPETVGDHLGIIVIALRQPNRTRIMARLEWALNTFSEASLRGRVFQLRDDTWLAFPAFS